MAITLGGTFHGLPPAASRFVSIPTSFASYQARPFRANNNSISRTDRNEPASQNRLVGARTLAFGQPEGVEGNLSKSHSSGRSLQALHLRANRAIAKSRNRPVAVVVVVQSLKVGGFETTVACGSK